MSISDKPDWILQRLGKELQFTLGEIDKRAMSNLSLFSFSLASCHTNVLTLNLLIRLLVQACCSPLHLSFQLWMLEKTPKHPAIGPMKAMNGFFYLFIYFYHFSYCVPFHIVHQCIHLKRIISMCVTSWQFTSSHHTILLTAFSLLFSRMPWKLKSGLMTNLRCAASSLLAAFGFYYNRPGQIN